MIEICGTTDTVLFVHSACTNTSISFEIAGACNDDAAFKCAPSSHIVLTVTAGSHYLVHVAQKKNALAGTPCAEVVTGTL